MERTILEEWNLKFGVKPPEWVVHFDTEPQHHILEDIDREIGKREANIEELELELEQERFLLDTLCAIKAKLQDHSSESQEHSIGNGVCVDVPKPQLDDSPNLHHISDTHKDTTEIVEHPTTTEGSKSSIESNTDSTEVQGVQHISSDTLSTDLSSDINSPVILRQRIAHKVQKNDAVLARSVSRRLIKHGRHWSCEFLDQIPENSDTSSSPTLLRRSASDPVPEKTPNKLTFLSTIEPTTSQIDPKSPELSCQELEDNITQEEMLSDDEVQPFASENMSRPLGGKRSSDGIILDSLDTNKILALEEERDEEDELMAAASRGSRAQRTRTPRSSGEQARIKIVRLSNGDLGGSNPNHRYPLEDKENSNAVYRRHKNSSEVPPNFRHSMNFDDECMTPKGELSMSLTPDSTIGMADNAMDTELEPSDIEDPTIAITCERAALINERRRDFGRSKTLTQESAEEMSSMIDNLVPVKEDVEDYPAQTLTRDRAHRDPDADMSNIPLSRLDSLSEDLQKALSQISSTPDMSMATLLDMEENIELNERLEKSGSDDSSLEDLELDEAMISAYTIRNDDLFGSSTSIPSLFAGNESFSSTCSSPPDNYHSPEHSFVPLRPSSSSRNRARKRMGNADLESIATGGSDESCEASPSHFARESASPIPDDALQFSIDKLSDSSSLPRERRSSRIFQGVQLKRSTVVVHGEQLVIRKLVVAGIVSAEKTYMDCLTAMREYYRKPLLGRATTTQPILPERDINTIFYRIDDLCVLHSTLHDQLEPTLAQWSIKTCVGEFFVHLCRNLKLYKDYVEMYKKSVDCLTKHKTESPQFKTFIEDVHATVSAHFKDIPRVNELLRRPVERLQSYSLVLNDLCQHTPEDHPDYRILRESLQVMTAFIASTHDPQSFKHLSGGFNRELVKDGLVVELSDGIRKIRRVFLFHDVLVCSKQKPSRGGVKFEAKWYLPLNEISFKPPEDTVDSHRPVAVTSDVELSVMKNKIAELKAQLSKTKEGGVVKTGGVVRDRVASTSSDKDDKSFKRNLKAQILGQKGKHGDKYRKKLEEQEVAYWVASPSLPLRLYGRAGKQFMFVLHTEEERETWVSAIKKLQPKAVTGVYLSSYELQDLLGRQTSKDMRKIEDMIIPTIDEEYLYGMLRVRVRGASDLKAKPAGVYCCLELDEYGKFERKARTIPTTTDNPTLVTSWDQDFEIELTGAHIMKVQICSKSLLKEETHAAGKTRLPIKELKQSKRQRVEIKLVPQGSIEILLEYFSNISAMARKPSLLSSGVFGVPIEIVTKRERHDIPLIVQTCIDEIERRGMSEVGIYRVAGVLRDVQELRTAFDTDYLRAQMIAFEADIHAVAGLLKRYFRELPDPLFTNEFYTNFVQALGLSDPEARAQCLLTLLHSLPPVNFKTAVFLFRHLRRVADNSSVNKMSLNNLSTVYGPNLLSPGGNEMQMDVVTPVSVVLFFLNCPAEYFDETLFGRSDLSTSTSSSNKSRNTGGRGSYTPSSEQRDSSINISVTPLPLKRVPTDELDAPLGSSPSRGINRRSRRSSNKLLVATKSETKTPIPSGKESLV